MKIAKEGSGDRLPGWQIPYCSLIILVVSLFVMLCSYATYGKGQLAQIQKSFKEALILLDLRQLFPSMKKPSANVSEDERFLQEYLAIPLQKYLKGKGLADEVILKSTRDVVQLTMLETALFLPGSTTLQPHAQSLLRHIGDLFRDVAPIVSIEGHTDPTFGGSAGWEQTALQAARVMEFFHQQCGIPRERLQAVGFSHYRPFVPNTSLEERRRNRRIDIVVPVDRAMFTRRGGITTDAPPSFNVWDLR
ncbi:MAG: OmpA family protein [Desulfobacterota bacterium]|nr:OmpA family protein [Thermodesulfobacteriota bacterium]